MATPSRRLLDYAAIRARISIADVLAIINAGLIHAPASQCRGRCPLHERDQPVDCGSTCFSANLQRSLFKCFRCGAQGNQLDLWRLYTKLPLYQATLDLCQRLHITPPPRRTVEPESRNSKTGQTVTTPRQN